MDLKNNTGTEIEMTTGITREEASMVGELFGTQPYYMELLQYLGSQRSGRKKSGSLPTLGASIHEEMETVLCR